MKFALRFILVAMAVCLEGWSLENPSIPEYARDVQDIVNFSRRIERARQGLRPLTVWCATTATISIRTADDDVSREYYSRWHDAVEMRSGRPLPSRTVIAVYRMSIRQPEQVFFASATSAWIFSGAAETLRADSATDPYRIAVGQWICRVPIGVAGTMAALAADINRIVERPSGTGENETSIGHYHARRMAMIAATPEDPVVAWPFQELHRHYLALTDPVCAAAFLGEVIQRGVAGGATRTAQVFSLCDQISDARVVSGIKAGWVLSVAADRPVLERYLRARISSLPRFASEWQAWIKYHDRRPEIIDLDEQGQIHDQSP